jgi:RHS repeat-associated protein
MQQEPSSSGMNTGLRGSKADGSGAISASAGRTLLVHRKKLRFRNRFARLPHRCLDPSTGRFTTRDTIKQGGLANLGNGLAFVGNNPWSYGDPFGHQAIEAPPVQPEPTEDMFKAAERWKWEWEEQRRRPPGYAKPGPDTCNNQEKRFSEQFGDDSQRPGIGKSGPDPCEMRFSEYFQRPGVGKSGPAGAIPPPATRRWPPFTHISTFRDPDTGVSWATGNDGKVVCRVGPRSVG